MKYEIRAGLALLVYYFQTTSSPNLYWVDLKEEDLSEGSPLRAVLQSCCES